MSIFEPLKPVKQRSKRPFIIIGIPVLLVAALLLCTNVNNDVQFVVRFFNPPAHFSYTGHSDAVSGVAWSPNGQRIASASSDGTVQVWDAANGGHVLTYHRHTSDVLTVAWSHDGRYLASGSADNSVQIWNASTGARILTYRGHTSVVTGVTWSSDDRYLASCDASGSAQVWQAANGKLITTTSSLGSAKGNNPAWNGVAWSPAGNKIALAGTGSVLIQDALTGKNASYYGNGGAINSLAWSPDGASIAFSSGGDALGLWNVAQKRQTALLSGRTSGDIYATAWSPNGKMIATGNADGLVEVWDAVTGRLVSTYRGHADFYPGHLIPGSGYAINSLAWSPDSTHIASAGNDKTVQVWHA